MNHKFPDTVYSTWSEEDKRKLAWLHRCGVPIEMTIINNNNWFLDTNHNPELFPQLKYRLKPNERS